MCGSLHGKDWLKIAGGLALGATGLGAVGIGPLAGLLGAASAAAPVAGGAAAGLGALDSAAAGGLGSAALFGPTAGGSALAAEGTTPFITGAGAAGSGMGGGTASLFGGAGLPGANLGGMFTAGLGEGAGGASLPTFGDKVASGLSNILPGGNDTLSSLKGGLNKLAKAQSAYQKASGLLSPPQGGGGAAPTPSPRQFGAGASPSNLSQYMNQPNSMMPSQGQGQLTPEMLALLLKMQQGGLYG